MLKFQNPVFKATIWSFIQKSGSMIISFIANMVLARLLCPKDFGCVGLLAVFTSFADILVYSGLGSALIQKKSISKEDIGTVFTVNMGVAIILFILMFFIASWVEKIMEIPNFATYLRVESICIIIRAYYYVQSVLFHRDLRFKDVAIYSIWASTISVTVAIVMAALGFGIWSLIVRNILQQIIYSLFYTRGSSIRSYILFRKKNFVELLSFGGFVALTNFMDMLYSNLLSFVVGKKYSVEQLGYYNQANSLQQIPTYTFSQVISQVLYPFVSKIQDDESRVVLYLHKSLSISAFIIFPIMFFLMFFGEPIIVLLYSAKWLPSVIFFKILCAGAGFCAIMHVYRSVLKSIGESKSMFYVQLLLSVLGIGIILIAMNFSVVVLSVFVSIDYLLSWIIIAIVTARKINYTFWNQLCDILPSLFMSFSICAVVFFLCEFFIEIPLLSLSIGLVMFVLLYWGLNHLFKIRAYQEMLQIVFPNRV